MRIRNQHPDGAVLVNGLPPSSLPSEILEHALYQRSFGDRNFEVVSENEVYKTVRRVAGFLYSFNLKSDGTLCVVETSELGERLELLDGTADGIELWAAELPTRLKQMHGHWLSRDVNVICIRGKRFFDRDVRFFLRLSLAEKNAIGDCFVIPDHLRSDPWREMVDSSLSLPRLVLHDSDLLTLFAKFEERQFVHFLLLGGTSSAFLNVSLPRYGLTFSYRDGSFLCLEISGFNLRECQQLEGSLFGFERYLVICTGTSRSEKSAISLLVADGDIVRSKLEGSTIVETSANCDKNVQWHKYDMHSRFQSLSANTVSSRLYLSALHASASFLSPDCDTLLTTGFERAIELIRGCWISRVLSCEESASLAKLYAACKGRNPSLSLLCTDLMQSSLSVPFLYGVATSQRSLNDEWVTCPSESAKYLNDLKCGFLNYHSRLLPNEERRILGQLGQMSTCRMTTSADFVAIGSSPIELGTSKQIEDSLVELGNCGRDPCHQRQSPRRVFPLCTDLQSSLEGDIIAELQASWAVYQKVSTLQDGLLFSSLSSKITSLQHCASHSRQCLENYIQDVLDNTNGMPMPSGMDLKRISRIHPQATTRDLQSAALHGEVLLEFNSCISARDRLRLQDYILEWLRLCVLEDKLVRLSGLSDDKEGLQKELRVFRNWDPSECPAWLVFEVEHCLQLWPEQAVVAKHLIDNTGSVVQLNMGMGKTR